jgi:hypothetical protein
MLFDIQNKKEYKCEFCEKIYKYSSGLSKHKKNCKKLLLHVTIAEGIETIKEEGKVLKDVAQVIKDQPKIVNNTINNINNTINIETYLNTECSEAMNFLDFINDITLTDEDVISMGKIGFMKTYEALITKKIKNMDIKDRPAHCTNLRKKLFFIKYKDIWTNDKDHKILNRSINILKDKECEAWYNYSLKMRDKYETDKEVNDRANAMSEIAKMNDDKYFKKIINNVSRELYFRTSDINQIKS